MTDKAKDLLGKINEAVAEANKSEKALKEAQDKHKAAADEHYSNTKKVGLLLLEVNKTHKGKDFENYLKQVKGLQRSRAYDYLRLAGGRVTEEELRTEARKRKQKSRAKLKELPPKPTAALPKPKAVQQVFDTPEEAHAGAAAEDSVTKTNVTEFPSIDASAKALADFKLECQLLCQRYMRKMTGKHRFEACSYLKNVVQMVQMDPFNGRGAAQ
jgi:hypothetical protein